MLTTAHRFTQAQDPTNGAARPAVNPVTGAVVAADRMRAYDRAAGIAAPTSVTFGSTFGSWTIECKPMPKVDLHPDRWPLLSTS